MKNQIVKDTDGLIAIVEGFSDDSSAIIRDSSISCHSFRSLLTCASTKEITKIKYPIIPRLYQLLVKDYQNECCL